MNTAMTLLQMALALLIAAQQPNVPESLRNQAINVAQFAIEFSEQEVQKQTDLAAPIESLVSIPSVGTSVDCTPAIQLSVAKLDGDIETGMDYMFYSTSTLPCVSDPFVTLQTPTIKYTGNLSDLLRNGDAKKTSDGFSYHQGWGTGIGVTPSGSFTLTVDGYSTTTSL